ncbi:MAG: MBOAT family O-acyltransferase [Planctomycetia bacterium]|jgi:alginate O-acetyltransferase complex protein AlgI
MLFSSPTFVFAFLPLLLALHALTPKSLRNGLLLAASLVFYWWGEPVASALMVASILFNWACGLLVGKAQAEGRGTGWIVGWALGANLALLFAFKYADWAWNGLSELLLSLGAIDAPLATIGSLLPAGGRLAAALLEPDGSVRLPIGISFFTFQAMSYVVDVARREGRVARNPADIALYVALFPQLIAGPIVRYKDVAQQIVERAIGLERFASGVRRFLIGLGKKMLVANFAARCCDSIFALPSEQLTPQLAWLGVACYTVQIYFDFSGYSCMAIGLGRMFGFEFLENFQHPYAARSITEFWRRWHISLSSWFRDYLYIPLGGNRAGKARTYFNLVLVFLLCGLWHGANSTFVAWGLWHGGFLVLERVGLGELLRKGPRALGHAYVLLAVMVGWVYFRAEDLDQAIGVLRAMAFVPAGDGWVRFGDLAVPAAEANPLALHADVLTWLALAAGCIGSTPWLARAVAWRDALEQAGRRELARRLDIAGALLLFVVFFLCALELAGGAYNPFIYFRF